MKKQTIKCNVYNCKYCDINCNSCNLKEIMIINSNKNKEKESTMCLNYDIRKD